MSLFARTVAADLPSSLGEGAVSKIGKRYFTNQHWESSEGTEGSLLHSICSKGITGEKRAVRNGSKVGHAANAANAGRRAVLSSAYKLELGHLNERSCLGLIGTAGPTSEYLKKKKSNKPLG